MANVTFSTPVGEARGDLHTPAGDGPCGALLIVHEWWGLNDDIRALAARFAAEGFLALAVDIYGGKVTEDASVAMQLVNEMKTEDALDVLRGAVALVREHPRSNGKVGVTGFCLGGAVSVAAAFQVDGLAAALPFYGNPRPDLVDLAKKVPPIQGHYAQRDGFVDPVKTKAIVDGVNAAGGSFEYFLYDANHAFMRAHDEVSYDEDAAKAAWGRAIPFLHAHLD